MSFLSMFLYSFNTSQAGWIFMWVILATGVFGIAIAIERFFFLMGRSGFRVEAWVKEVIGFIQKDEIQSAQRLIDKSGKMALGQVFKAAISESGSGAERIRNAVDESSLKIIPQLEKRTGFLGTIGNIATLLSCRIVEDIPAKA